jgi:aerobic carbon-monoxide dehydrogenase large subunit
MSLTAARYAGARVPRVEDPRLLTGRGVFVDDVVRPGMLHVHVVRSPLARARILGIDVSAALAAPGVHAVLLAEDVETGAGTPWYSHAGPDVPVTVLPLLARDEVRFAGDPVALVVAEDRYLAEDAADLVEVDYDPLPPVVDYAQAQDRGEAVHAHRPDNLAGRVDGRTRADLEPVYAGAAHVVEHEYRQQGCSAAPMEPRGLVVEWAGDELTIWSATQAPHEVRAVVARTLGVGEHRVRVVAKDTGGGFGQKVAPQREELAVVLAARRFPVALKWVEDRRENLLAAGQGRREHGLAGMAFDAEGRILAAHLDHVQDVGAYPVPWPLGTGAAVGMLFPGPYRVPAAGFAHRSVFSHTPGRVAYRGPWMFETVARELLLDEAARRMAMDPVELRRRNLLGAADMPYANPNGMPYDRVTPLETFEHALELLDYPAFRKAQAEARAQGRHLGVGTGTYIEPTTSGIGHQGTEATIIRVDTSGAVTVHITGGSAGNSLETAAAQLTADALGARLDQVGVVQGDTAVSPFGAGTGGSRSGGMIAGAVSATAAELRERLIAIAAHRLEADPADVELAQGRATVRGAPDAGVTFAELAGIAYLTPHLLPPGIVPGLEAQARYRAETPVVFANATHVCTCEVDVVTGGVRLLRYIVAEDCGPMINPTLVEGQIAGGTAQGIGNALLENLTYDEDGNPTASTLMDYLLPLATDVPDIEYGHVESRSAGAGGYKGVGEGGAIGSPAAVVNAVADALAPFGVRFDRLPLTPSVIVAALEAVGA